MPSSIGYDPKRRCPSSNLQTKLSFLSYTSIVIVIGFPPVSNSNFPYYCKKKKKENKKDYYPYVKYNYIQKYKRYFLFIKIYMYLP